MKTAYTLMILSFLLSLSGAAFGAAMNDRELMLIGHLPGLVGMFGLMFVYRK